MAEEMGVADGSQQYAPESKSLSDPAISLPVELWRSILLTQLVECWNDTRNIDNLVWQIPAGIGAILGLIISGLGVRALSGQPDLLDVGAMCAVLFISSSLVLALYKNRMFQVSRSI